MSTPTNESPAPQADTATCVCCGKPAIGKCSGPDPAPQPPVEGLREALKVVRQRLALYAQPSSEWEKPTFDLIDAALASPSLTAPAPDYGGK